MPRLTSEQRYSSRKGYKHSAETIEKIRFGNAGKRFSKLEKAFTWYLASKLTGTRVISEAKLVGLPDIYLQDHKICVFIDGCFWHCCPTHKPTATKKFPTRRARDARVSNLLARKGYKVIRIWEHDMTDFDVVVAKIKEVIQNNSVI